MYFFITTPFSIEDLAPLKEAGSDAIVIGTPFFSVRPACVFEFCDLSKIRSKTKELGLQMFVLVNRMFCDDELQDLTTYLEYLKTLSVDGIYFCDEGVLQIAKSLQMEDRLIYQPDTLITNGHDLDYYLSEGLKMVTLAKEITLEEMCEIAQSSNGKKIEVMVHGRQNMMHSKRNLLSSYMKHIHRDESLRNRRTLTLKEETREDYYPIIEDELGTHVFTGFTLAAFGQIQALSNAGIVNFRIDGIFHDVEYVCEALSYYRAILDGEKDGDSVFEAYCHRYPKDHVTTGFLYQWTGLHKERL